MSKFSLAKLMPSSRHMAPEGELERLKLLITVLGQ